MRLIISDINDDRVEWFFVLIVILKLNIHLIEIKISGLYLHGDISADLQHQYAIFIVFFSCTISLSIT